jgi:hypothetical protein
MADINLGGSVGTTGTAILGRVTVTIPSDADYTLLVSEYTNQFLNVTSGVSLTATRNIIVPVIEGVTYIVQNNTTGSQAIQIIGSTGTGIMISNGDTVSVVCDGTNYLQSSGGGSAASLPITFQPSGTAESNVFTTEASLNTAVSGAFGPQTVYLDFSAVSGFYTATGNINLGTYVIGTNYGSNSTFLSTSHQITSGSSIEFRDVSISNFTGPMLTSSTQFVRLTGILTISCNDTNFVWVPSTSSSVLDVYGNSTVGNGTNAIVQINTTKTLNVNLYDSAVLTASALTIVGSGAVNLNIYSAAVSIDPSYFTLSGVTIKYFADANIITGNSNEFAASGGSITNIISTETIIASGTIRPIKSSVCTFTSTGVGPFVIATYTPATNTVVDWNLSVVAVNTNYGGEFYRADMSFTTVTTPALTMYPTTPSPVNIRTALSGFNYDISAAISGSDIEISVAGVAATTIEWSCILQIQIIL